MTGGPGPAHHAPWKALLEVGSRAPLSPLSGLPWLAWLGPEVADDHEALVAVLSSFCADLVEYPVAGLAGWNDGWPGHRVLAHSAAACRQLGGGAASAVVVALCDPASFELRALYPLFNLWEHAQRVTVRGQRMAQEPFDAVLEADLHLGDSTLLLGIGLPTFALERHLLRPGAEVQIALTALAARCAPVQPRVFTIRQSAERIEDLRRQGMAPLPTDAQGLTHCSDEGMVAWLFSDERNDVVNFRGRVQEVHAIALPPATPAWHLRARAWRAQEVDWLLDVVFAATCWQGSAEPRAGDEVEGRAWLQGQCLGSA